VYFRDKEELLFAIGERAMGMLRDRFVEAATGHALGLDKVEAIGRAYMGYAMNSSLFRLLLALPGAFGLYRPGVSRRRLSSRRDEAISVVVQVIEAGVRDGSIRPDIGEPLLLATTLWAFTHGIIQLAMAKAAT